MKKFVLVALLALLTVGMNAQVFYTDDHDAYEANHHSNNKYRKHLAANHITSLKIYSYSHKHPEGILVCQQSIDARGNVVEYIRYDKHGKIKYHFKYQFNDSDLQTSLTNYKKNEKALWGRFCNYDKHGNMTESRSWWKDTSNVTYDYTAQYNLNNNITESKTYLHNKKLDGTAMYEYYEDGSKKKTTTYNRKGKVTGVWNYNCNPVGKSEESKMKDTSKICVHYETDKNGNPVKIKEEYTEGGWLFKYRLRKITKYNKDNRPLEEIITKMNGKEISHSTCDYDAQGNWTGYCEYKPGTATVKKRFVYDYDNSGNLTQITAYTKSAPAGAVMKYVYN